MSGIGFMHSTKPLNPGNRRRRRCDKHQHLELNCDQPDLIPQLDSIPVTPITPPAAFLAPGYKRRPSRGEPVMSQQAYILHLSHLFTDVGVLSEMSF